MKKLLIIFIGIVVVLLSWISEIAFSLIEEERWSHYMHTWETKWTSSLY